MHPDLPLAEQTVVVLKKSASPLELPRIFELLELLPQWRLETNMGIQQLVRIFEFPDFTKATEFSKFITAMADEANHHPLQNVQDNLLTMYWWTHSIRGLHLNDFIMAARCDELYLNN